MMKRALLLPMLLVFAAGAYAQTWPTRPVRVLVGYAAGGGMDAITRIATTKLSEVAGQQFVVENRPGASATLAADVVARAAPDGYTLYMAETGFLVAPAMYPKLAFDPLRNFAPVAMVASLPLAIVVHPDVPARTTQDFADWLKASPGKHSYGSPGIGSLQHLAMELFRRQIGADLVHVPYRGAGPMMPDLMSGQIPIGVISVAPALAQARSGKLRTIAVTSPARLPQAPDWPALAEFVPRFDAAPRVFLLGPTGLPEAIVSRLAEALRQVLAVPDVLESLAKQGASAQWSNAADLAAAMSADTTKWVSIAREAEVKVE